MHAIVLFCGMYGPMISDVRDRFNIAWLAGLRLRDNNCPVFHFDPAEKLD